MIDNRKIWFVSLIRGKLFPRPTTTQVNIHQIPQHSRLTWPGSCLPFQQSLRHPFILFVPPTLTSLCLHVPLFLPLLPLLSLLGTPFPRHVCMSKSILKSMARTLWPPWIPLLFLSCPSQALCFFMSWSQLALDSAYWCSGLISHSARLGTLWGQGKNNVWGTLYQP